MKADVETLASGNLAAPLQELELRLLEPEFRIDTAGVSALLAEEFREFGSSGRVWNKETTLALLGGEIYEAPAVEDMSVEEITAGVALVTYRTVRPNTDSGGVRVVLRSSLWVYRNGRWQMVFHQGTKVPDA